VSDNCDSILLKKEVKPRQQRSGKKRSVMVTTRREKWYRVETVEEPTGAKEAEWY